MYLYIYLSIKRVERVVVGDVIWTLREFYLIELRHYLYRY